MALPYEWIEMIFARLAVRYGAEWLRKWEGVDIEAVKADWAEELSGFAKHKESLLHALSNLPADKPPTVGQFRDLCIKAPKAYVPELPAPKASKAKVDALMANLKPNTKTEPKAWAFRLRDQEARGVPLSSTQKSMWRAALSPELAKSGDAA